MDRLPVDLLPGILGRLDPRSLAACRDVCREWRRAVDDGRFLLLPRWLHGIFFNYKAHWHSHLLSRRRPPPGIRRRPATASSAAAIDGVFHFMRGSDPWQYCSIKDHCNGLFLYDDGNHRWRYSSIKDCNGLFLEEGYCDKSYAVCNPATRRWRRLPPRTENSSYAAAYLVFDPAASLHYEVVLLPSPPGTERPRPYWYLQQSGRRPEKVEPLMEWPPAVLKMEVFSSRTEQWEKRQFVREGGAAVTIADVLSDRERPRRSYGGPNGRYAEYWKGALYVHCRGSFVMRLSLSDNTCKATKTPVFVKENKNILISFEDYDSSVEAYLGRSEKGIYYVILHDIQIWIWSLNESGQQMEWALQHHSDLSLLCKTLLSKDIQYFKASWVLADYRKYKVNDDVVDEHSQWSSDDSDNGDGEEEDDNENYSNLTLDDLIYSNIEETSKNDGHDENCDGEEDGDEDQGSLQQNIDDTDDDGNEKNDGVDGNEEHGNSQQSSDNSDNSDDEEDDDDEKYSEWNSDDDFTLEIKYSSENLYDSDFYFLGFHPYKEVVFLADSYRVVAYHLGCCKAKYLGHRRPRGFGCSRGAALLESFPYSPCFIDALPDFQTQHMDETDEL